MEWRQTSKSLQHHTRRIIKQEENQAVAEIPCEPLEMYAGLGFICNNWAQFRSHGPQLAAVHSAQTKYHRVILHLTAPAARSAHNESCSSAMRWPGTGVYTWRHAQTLRNTKAHTLPSPFVRFPVACTPGHLAQGSKAACRSNQSSQWATPLIRFCFISGEQTTSQVGTFLGSRGPGVIPLSLNDQSPTPQPVGQTTLVSSRMKTGEIIKRERTKTRRRGVFSQHGREVE